jgi:AraC family transcriptional regulator
MAGEHRTVGGRGSRGGDAAPDAAAASDTAAASDAAREARERERRRRSAVPFLDARSHRPVDALETSRLIVSSQPLGWPGVLVEAGSADTWEVDELTVAHHYLAMNVGTEPLRFEVKGPHGFRPTVIEPGAVWVCPAGESFTHRVEQSNSFALVTIDPLRFAAVTGGPERLAPPLRRDYNLRAPALEHVVRALVVEADRGGPTGLAMVDALVTAVSHAMVQLAGAAAPPADAPARGGLAPRARRRVLELIEARLGAELSVDELARAAELSPAHFARAFRETLGRPPHQYILARRLERARLLLEAPDARPSEVAAATGFADQAHLTRLFKRAFGVTPGAVLRQRGRPAAG